MTDDTGSDDFAGDAGLLAEEARRAAGEPVPERLARQQRIRTGPNPNPKVDYLVFLEGRVSGGEAASVRVSLRYVPGKLVLAPEAFQAYLDALPGAAEASLEALGQTVMDDLNNEVVARWVQLALIAGPEEFGRHTVLLEDRQPRWDNQPLLARVPPP